MTDNNTDFTNAAVLERQQADRRSRLLEVSISVMASALVSAITVSWTLSASLAEIRAEYKSVAQRIERIESDVKAQDAVNNQQSVVQAGTSAQLTQISALVTDMSRKVDEIYRNQVR